MFSSFDFKYWVRKTRMLFLTAVSSIIKKKSNLYFFYDKNAISLNEIEIVRYMVEQEEYKDSEIVLYTNKKVLLCNIVPEQFVVSNPFKGLWAILRARFVFVEQNCQRWCMYPVRGQIIVQLWHGLPQKKVGYLHNKHPLYSYNKGYSKVLAPSEYGWHIMKTCFHYDETKRIICGSPRNDGMARIIKDEQLSNLGINAFRTIIMWMPTFRNNITETDRRYGVNFPLIDEKNIRVLDDFLEDTDYQIVIKTHPLQEQVTMLNADYRNIIFVDGDSLLKKGVTVYQLLGRSSALITDYSSTAYDYMTLDRPIIYTTDDIDDYKATRGFIESDIDSIFGGVRVNTLDELITQISLLSNDEEQKKWAEKRHARCCLINANCEPDNCQRLLMELKNETV